MVTGSHTAALLLLHYLQMQEGCRVSLTEAHSPAEDDGQASVCSFKFIRYDPASASALQQEWAAHEGREGPWVSHNLKVDCWPEPV